MITKQTMIAALEEQYNRRLERWYTATTEGQRANEKQLLDRIDEMITSLKNLEEV
jgi:hypothetical protein